MALRINQEITTVEGFSVPSGTIVKFKTTFPLRDYTVHYNMEFYRNQASYDANETNYFPVELSSLGYMETIDPVDYTGLTPTIINQNLKDYLAMTYTAGTIDIIM